MLQLHVPMIHAIVAYTDTTFGLYSGSADNIFYQASYSNLGSRN